ncbi:hypothetical protein Mc24_08384 [Thermotoga sp. Mc24]|uniref:lipopolysaccharide biosynthesis protein n=1 Tax=Thermotoga sp. Mc24 TaxID=1231241 RepID=UPI000543118D|nr:oligosaccharide flippase family protein [Thermotoga sp. Mc24]KHC90363.1 hypothetical protein Mc24_08384 [Thermotoga sp. Mc24]
MRQYKKLAVNTFLFAIGNIGSQSIIFLMLPIFTRYMIPEDFGKLDVINTTVSLLAPILSLQIIEAVFRFTVEFRKEQKSEDLLSSALLFSTIAIVFSLSLHPILTKISIFSKYSTYFYAIFYLTILGGIVRQYIRGIAKIKLYVTSDILYSIIFFTSNLILLVGLKLGVEAYLLSNILALLISSLFIIIFAGLHKQIRLKLNKNLLKEMLIYSVPLIPNGIMWWIISAADRYIIAYFLGYESIGIYSVAAKFPGLLTVLYRIFFQAWQLSSIEEYGKESYGVFFGRVFGVISSIMFLLSSLFFLIVKPFMNMFVGEAFVESWKYVPFLFLGAVFHTFASFYSVNYTVSKKTIGAFSTSAIAAGVKLTSILTLIRFLDIQAASVSSFLAYLSMWIVRVFHTRKIVKVELDVKHVVISSTIVLSQAILLLMIKNTFLLYALQAVLLTILLWNQKKYISKVVRFGRSFVESKANK